MGRLSAFLLATCAIASLARAGELRGVVRDATTNQPISGAELWLRASVPIARPNSVTGSNGEFVFSELRSGKYSLSCTKPGYVSLSPFPGLDAPYEILEGASPRPIEIQLRPSASIEGRIVDEGGVPIVGAKIYVFGGGSTGTTSGANGTFQLDGLRAEDTMIGAKIPEELRQASIRKSHDRVLGYPSAIFYNNSFDYRSAARIDSAQRAVTSGIVFVINRIPLVTFSGTVVDGSSGKPAEGVHLQLDLASEGLYATASPRTALKDGRFHFGNLQPGAYHVKLYRTGNRSESATAREVLIGPVGLADYRLNLSSLVTVSGHVSGPLPSRRTICLDARSNASSSFCGAIDEQRNFTIAGVEPGEYRVGIGAQPATIGGRYVSAFSVRSGTSTPNHTVTIHPAGNAPLEVTLAEQFLISGEVRGSDGKLFTGFALVLVTPPGSQFLTARDGRFGSHLFPGTYTLGGITDWSRGGAPCPNAITVNLKEDVKDLVVPMCP